MNFIKTFYKKKFEDEIESLKKENKSLKQEIERCNYGEHSGGFWKENGRLIVSILIVVAIAVGIYMQTRRDQVPLRDNAGEKTVINKYTYETELKRIHGLGFKKIKLYINYDNWVDNALYINFEAEKEVKMNGGVNKVSIDQKFSTEEELIKFLNEIK